MPIPMLSGAEAAFPRFEAANKIQRTGRVYIAKSAVERKRKLRDDAREKANQRKLGQRLADFTRLMRGRTITAILNYLQ
jgi:hypothetical protein